MGKTFGDEIGFFWDQPVTVKVGSSSKQGAKPAFKRPLPPAPDGYLPPEQFPEISKYKRISLDVESFDPDLKAKGPGWRRDAYVVGVGVATDGWEGDYYPRKHQSGPNVDPDKLDYWLQKELKDFKGEIVGTNLLYDADGMSETMGVKFNDNAKWRDILTAEPLLDENQYTYNLQRLSNKWLGYGKQNEILKDLYGDDYIYRMHEVHPGHMKGYVLGDIRQPLEIHDLQTEALEKEGMTALHDMECRLTPFLLYLRRKGVRVDLKKAEEFNHQLDIKVADTLARIRDMVGFNVNVNANESVAKAFDKLGLAYPYTKPSKNFPNGQPSFVAKWLENHHHEVSSLIVGARKYEKFKGTFVESYIFGSHIHERLHCQFHPLRCDEGGAVSGRFSCSTPNLQNIPTRDEILGPMCRSLFIPEEGCLWWSLDYSQIEYRLLVHYAVLAKCFGADVAAGMFWNNPDTDFHKMVAELTGLPRKSAKNINFGLVYGMGVPTLAANLGLSIEDAKPILNTYHDRAPFIKQVYNMASNRAKDIGFIRTILDRKRRFDLWEPNTWQLAEGEERSQALHHEEALQEYGDNIRRAYTHKALNSVLQGSAADMMKKAMVDVWESGAIGYNTPLQCHLTVHDELDGSMEDTPEGHQALAHVKQLMIDAIPLKVPVLVSGATGANWSEAK